jgi:hypothetical protein
MKISVAMVFAILVNANNLMSQFAGGNGTANSPYQITTKQHLELLADSVNDIANNSTINWSRNKYFIVMNDITDSVKTIIGNFTASKTFQGNFNGNQKRIILAIDTQITTGVGLFGGCGYADIYDVIVDGYVIGDINVAGISGYANQTNITRCINYAQIGREGFSMAGGICGVIYETNISHCINYGNVYARDMAGGICGNGWGLGTPTGNNISYCINYGTVISIREYAGGIAAGFVGFILHCKNYGNIYADSAAGGIAGCVANDVYFGAAKGKISYCLNSGYVSGKHGVAGITGHAHEETEISFNINIGTIRGDSLVGGISSGYDNQGYSDNGIIHHCINSGLVVGKRKVGGIIGECFAEVHHCLNTGVVPYSTSTDYSRMGGIFGSVTNAFINRAKNNFNDIQMCYWGPSNLTSYPGRADDKLTNEFIGDNLQSILGDEHWVYSDNLYPT